MPVARSTGFDMRNTQNLSIIRSEPPPAIGDETTGLCRALPWALFRGCWRWVFLPSLWQ
ncbi:hypothetical protein H7U18_19405 [Klebsiella pneumoniae]|uniref:Uncharacterized protein n=1 Tax=Klebsiella pneumoniae TaxID=573 RepID=A0A923ERY7_KLEPN|nr:hypothetical protein [Klebsiella pneumoniae]